MSRLFSAMSPNYRVFPGKISKCPDSQRNLHSFPEQFWLCPETALELSPPVTLRPFRHRPLTWKVYWVAIATPWIISVSLAILTFVLRRCLRPSDAVLFVLAFLTTPLLIFITCFSYFVIWKTTSQSRNKVRSFRQNQKARFSRAISIVTVASFVTWMLFQLCNIVLSVSPKTLLPLSAIFFITLVQFSNSFVNFVVYFLRFPRYRKALLSSVHVSCIAQRYETLTIPLPSPK